MSTLAQDTKSSHDRVMDIIFKEDDLNWKDMIFDLVRSEGMDPWDINVSLLSQKFLTLLSDLKETDFRVSGKMVLAASLLLKIKSDRLLLDDINRLDQLINGPQEVEDDFLEEDSFEFEQQDLNSYVDQGKIVPRTPQPRERKVSVFDLVQALEQALDADVKRQRVLSQVKQEPEVKAPEHKFDIGEKMESLYKSLHATFNKKTSTIYFHDLVDTENKREVVYTFLPLLHLENQRKVDLLQEEHFGDIAVQVHEHKL